MTEAFAPAIELGAVAEGLGPHVQTLSFVPAETSASGPHMLSPGTDYQRVALLFADADDPTYLVIGGYADVIFAQSDEPDLDDVLSFSLAHLDYPGQASAFADLVADPDELKETLSRAHADTAPDLMVLVLDTFIDPCFRGHNFGLALLRSVYDFACTIAEQNDLRLPVCIGYFGPDTPAPVVQHWRKHLHLQATAADERLMVLPEKAGLPSAEAIIMNCQSDGYIKVDAEALRDRLAAGDETLWPSRDRRHLRGETVSEADALMAVTALQAAAASRIALDAVGFDGDADCEVVTAVRFLAHTGDDGDEPSELFARAAEYLDAHPEVSVVSTNWNESPCNSGGVHLALELIVRVGGQ